MPITFVAYVSTRSSYERAHERLRGQVEHDLGRCVGDRRAQRARRRARRRRRDVDALADAAPARTATARSATPSAKPVDLGAERCSHSASQLPLKPVWPVTSTRRPRQNARRHVTTTFHGARARRPQLLEVVLVAQRVHRLPEAVVAVGGELALARRGARSGSCSQTVVVAVDVVADLAARARRSRR